MDSDTPTLPDEPLADLLAACDDALARGDQKTSHDALRSSGGAERQKLRKKLACVNLLRQLWPKGPPKPAARPERVGRFEIRRELGRGGYGVVYQAYDPKLGRDVALKLPREDLLLTPALRERFQTEARAAAGLDHPNIVPVYEAGEVGPTCYIASAYCPGQSRDEWLRQRKEPVPTTWAAELLAALADGVQHAHDRGVLHRDLKPGNVLLTVGSRQYADGSKQKTEADESSSQLPTAYCLLPTAKITDFGLAKLAPSATPDAEARAITRSGAIVGTPAYMAPEQAGGLAAGPPADVYALGAVLYEVLTGRPPFVADTVLDTLALVRSAEPVSPGRLRAKLPRDLETICLKCLRKEPAKRYASAAELAADLRRFRAGEAIRARPVSSGERVWRWCRRNPAAAWLAAALAVALTAGVAVGVSQWLRANAAATTAGLERDSAQAARRAAEVERDRAEANFRRANQAVSRMADAGRGLYRQKGQDEAGRKILEEALAFQEGFVAEKGDDPAVLLEAARTWANAARIRGDLGRRKGAIEAAERSRSLFQLVLADNPGHRAARVEHAYQTRQLANFYRRENQVAPARRYYEEALAAYREFVSDFPDDAGARSQVANTLVNLAVLLQDDEPANAESMCQDALTLQEELVRGQPTDFSYRRERALAREMLGLLRWRAGPSDEAAALCRAARADFQTFRAEQPANEERRWLAARASDYVARQSAGANAEALYAESIADLAALTADYPRNARYALMTVNVWHERANARHAAGRTADTETAYVQAEKLLANVLKTFPEEAESRRNDLADLMDSHAQFLARTGRQPEALALIERGRARWRDEPVLLAGLARLLATSDPARAAELARQATDAKPNVASYWAALGLAHLRGGRLVDARAAFERGAARPHGLSPADQLLHALTLARSGDLSQGRQRLAAADADHARRPQGNPEWPQVRAEAAKVFGEQP